MQSELATSDLTHWVIEMSGRAIEQHDKPAVQHAEAPHNSPVHEQVQSLQRSAALEKSPSSQAPQPKELDFKAPIAGAGSEFNATPATRGLSRDSAAAEGSKSLNKSPGGSSDANPKTEDTSPNRVATHSADATQTATSQKPNERPANGSVDGTPITGSKVSEKAGDNGSTDSTPSSGTSISTMNDNFVKQFPTPKYRLGKENGGANELNDDGAAKPSNLDSSQFKLNLNPNSTANPSDFPQGSPFYTNYPPTPASELKFKADKFGDQKSQVPKGLSDAGLTPEQRASASPSQRRAEADKLLQKQPGNSPEQNAQIDENRAQVRKFDEGVHRQTLIDKAGSGALGTDGGNVVAGMTESKDFRIEARKVVKDN